MGNEVSRPAEDLSPPSSGVVPPRSPYTPTGGASRRAQSFNSPSPGASQPARRVSSSANLSNPRKERTIQRMDKAIRRRVRGGITYNMKLLLRGARGTGKTSLFQRLQGQPIPETHQPTPQLQAATISWSFRQHLEENVKCEVWDVVDRGFVPADDAEGGGLSTAAPAQAPAAVQNGTHAVAVVDASTVDVYQEAHGVIFLLDVTKWDTLEYVKQQLDSVPVHIPTLVLGNFRDLGAQRKIFKEDVEELLYGSSDRPQQQWRRPTELLYFECSLLDCYGLKSLHQYFGIPFLQLKLATIRQQMRIVEGEFAHLKHDVQATISEQRYAEYVEHIKATGSDIRTGRRGSGNGNTPPAVSRTDSVRISPRSSSQTTPTTQQEGGDDDVSVVRKRDAAGTPPKTASEVTAAIAATTAAQQVQELPQVVDAEDLPARNSSAVIQAAPPLKFEHRESIAAIPDNAAEAASVSIEEKPVSPVGRSGDTPAATKSSPSRPQKASIEEVIHLEDFQVPKARMSDLDHFYSEDESDEEAGDYDKDVVVAPVDGVKKASIAGVYHKQRFLDSDSSDSDESETARAQSRRKTSAPHRRSPRNAAVKQSSTTGQQMPRPPASSSPSPPSPHPPTTLSRPTQRSRPGSPARAQSSSPTKDCQDVLSQQQTSSPITGAPVSVTPTPPASPPTSPSTSSIRHSIPRDKCESTTTTPQSETHQFVSLTQRDENEVKSGASTGEEPELTGTEDGAVPVEQDEQELTDEISTQQSPKHFDNNTLATSKQVGDKHASAVVGDAEEASNGAPTETEESELPGSLDITTPTATSTEDDVKREPKDVSTYNEEDTSIKEADRGSVDGDDDEEEAGMDDNSNELSSFLADENDSDEEDGTPEALQAERTVTDDPVPLVGSSVARRPDVLMSDEESESNDDRRSGSSSLLLSSEPSLPSASVLPPPMDALNQGAPHQDQSMGNFHRRNLEGAGDLLSLSVLQASLPMPGPGAVPVPSTSHESAGVASNADINEAALHVSDLQVPSTAPMSDFSTVVPRNDLEAFLNESDSDSEDAAPPSYVEPSPKRAKSTRRAVVESSDDDEDEEGDQDRFASYSISKKSRSERRRQQKEDLRQLNAALDNSSGQDGVRSEPFTPSATGVAALGTSSDVMEAIRKAQEEAMRMLPTADDDADSSSSKKRHKHKHKKEHKHKKREGEDGPKEKSAKKSSRKSGSSSRSKKRRPHVEDDVE